MPFEFYAINFQRNLQSTEIQMTNDFGAADDAKSGRATRARLFFVSGVSSSSWSLVLFVEISAKSRKRKRTRTRKRRKMNEKTRPAAPGAGVTVACSVT